jgi:hypothetical protein
VHREAFLQKKIPTEIVGFDISIKEWIVIILKLNVALACIVIPFYIALRILISLFSLN